MTEIVQAGEDLHTSFGWRQYMRKNLEKRGFPRAISSRYHQRLTLTHEKRDVPENSAAFKNLLEIQRLESNGHDLSLDQREFSPEDLIRQANDEEVNPGLSDFAAVASPIPLHNLSTLFTLGTCCG